MAPRAVIRLTAAVLLAATAGCCGWRVGGTSPNYSAAQGQISGPAPAFLLVAGRDGEGWGTATPLDDGTLLTAEHVFRRFPLQIDGKDVHSLDTLRRGGGGELGTPDLYVGDWVQFRAEPFEHAGWPVSAARPKVGDIVVIRGFARARDPSKRPVLVEAHARIREAPSWIDDSQRHLIYAQPADGASAIDHAGLSGGPVLLKDATTGEETLVGIFSGGMSAKWLIFRKQVWVIQPWPPVGE